MNNQTTPVKEDEIEKLSEEKFPFNADWNNINYEQGQRLKAHMLQRREDFKAGYAASTPSEQAKQEYPGDEKIDEDIRLIISHALLGSDINDVKRETWDLCIGEIVKYIKNLSK